MKIFVDTTDLDAIEEALTRGFISGITTNPSILVDAPGTDYCAHIGTIIDVCRRYGQLVPVSVEVFPGDEGIMERQARQLVRELAYEGLSIKIPISWDGLRLIAALTREGIQVNCTHCVAFNQGIIAANAGARYITVTRASDLYDAASIITDLHQALQRSERKTEVIMGGISHINHGNEAIRAGVDIVALAPELLEPMCIHRKTDELVQQSAAQFEEWLKLEHGASG